jgi:hypothetical protein
MQHTEITVMYNWKLLYTTEHLQLIPSNNCQLQDKNSSNLNIGITLYFWGGGWKGEGLFNTE